MVAYRCAGMAVNVPEPSHIDDAAERRARADEDLTHGWDVRARRRGRRPDRGRPRGRGMVGAAAMAVACLVAWPVLGRGVAAAATLPAAEVVSSITPFDSTPNKLIAAVCPLGKRV